MQKVDFSLLTNTVGKDLRLPVFGACHELVWSDFLILSAYQQVPGESAYRTRSRLDRLAL
jgi:hypothetical protein